jgi:hypothetical protein
VRPDDSAAQQVFLRHVVVSYNNRSVLADTLTEAIQILFPNVELDLGDTIPVSGGGPSRSRRIRPSRWNRPSPVSR